MYYILSYTNTNMYTFIYIYKHICSYMHTYMQMHPHPHTDIHIHLVIADLEGRSKLHDKVAATSTPQTWVGLCINTNPTCVCVCARAHTHYACMHECARVYAQVHACMHVRARMCVHVCLCVCTEHACFCRYMGSVLGCRIFSRQWAARLR